MKDKEGVLRGRIIGSAIFGRIGTEETVAMLAILSGAPIFKEVAISTDGQSKEVFSDGQELLTLDITGNPLRIGINYLLNEKKVKILREKSGFGNIMDTWQWVYYLTGDLEEEFAVVKGSYPGGIFGPTVFRSRFTPITS